MTQADIDVVVGQFRQAARNAMLAGFDGIELHAANGYLINQFLDSESNTRTDGYGGSLENRLRFLKEVTEAVCSEIGADRVGVRLAPLTTLNGTVDANPQETYLAAARLLGRLDVVYLHIAEADWDDAPLMAEGFKQGCATPSPTPSSMPANTTASGPGGARGGLGRHDRLRTAPSWPIPTCPSGCATVIRWPSRSGHSVRRRRKGLD